MYMYMWSHTHIKLYIHVNSVCMQNSIPYNSNCYASLYIESIYCQSGILSL